MSPNAVVSVGVDQVPDRVRIWLIDDERYGLDAVFRGATGYDRAAHHQLELAGSGIPHHLRQEPDDVWVLRFGPLAAGDVVVALSGLVTSTAAH